MEQLILRDFHERRGARLTEVNGRPAVNDYGDWLAEHAGLRQAAGLLDLSFRSRLCLVGGDRARFLHGQVTNDVKGLRAGQGCYAALTTAKGKMEADANILCLADELLLDFEPGYAQKIAQRLEQYIVADDVQVVDAAPHYGLLSLQGPGAEAAIRALGLFNEIPASPLASVKISDPKLGEVYLANNARLRPLTTSLQASQTCGYDLYVPNDSLIAAAEALLAAVQPVGGRLCGWQALETARIEAGIPRLGADMDENSIPLECGLEGRAVAYDKGCYLGQEVINRIHSVGHVNRELRGLRLADGVTLLPRRGDRLFHAGKEAGHITSAVLSPALNAAIALGCVRREANAIGTQLVAKMAGGEVAAAVVALPFG